MTVLPPDLKDFIFNAFALVVGMGCCLVIKNQFKAKAAERHALGRNIFLNGVLRCGASFSRPR